MTTSNFITVRLEKGRETTVNLAHVVLISRDWCSSDNATLQLTNGAVIRTIERFEALAVSLGAPVPPRPSCAVCNQAQHVKGRAAYPDLGIPEHDYMAPAFKEVSR